MYPMQMGDGYNKYYSQPNHLPYATYNSGEMTLRIIDDQRIIFNKGLYK